jgi:hypothetical protein
LEPVFTSLESKRRAVQAITQVRSIVQTDLCGTYYERHLSWGRNDLRNPRGLGVGGCLYLATWRRHSTISTTDMIGVSVDRPYFEYPGRWRL